MRALRDTTIIALLLLAAGMPSALSAQVKSVQRISVATDGTQANASSFCPQVSDDGRFVTFSSAATNLSSENGAVLGGALYYRDTATSTTTLVSENVNYGGCDYDMSADGRYIAYGLTQSSPRDGLFLSANQVVLADMQSATRRIVSVDSQGQQGMGESNYPSISSDGRYIAFTSKATNLVSDPLGFASEVFVYDAQAGSVTRVSVSNSGSPANGLSYSPDISADGRKVLFQSTATNLIDASAPSMGLYVRDLDANTTTLVNYGSGIANIAMNPALSPDGRYVVLLSDSSEIVSGDSNNVADVFVYDLQFGSIERVSVGLRGTQANAINYLGVTRDSVSNNASYIAFGSKADNLVKDDINGNFDVFVRDRTEEKTLIGSIRGECLTADEQANETSEGAAISSDGKYLVFGSIADNLVSADTNGAIDIFLVELSLPQPFSASLNRSTPPNVSTCNSDAAVYAPLFLSSAAQSRRLTALKKRIPLIYEIVIAPDSAAISVQGKSSDVKRKYEKRNSTTFRDLPPGSYTSKYRVVRPSGDGGYRPRSKYSPASGFTVN